MTELTTILRKYETGEASLEEINATLAEIAPGLYFDPNRNTIKPEEKEEYGYLNTGTGTRDKVRVIPEKMELTPENDMGNTKNATVEYMGKIYRVEGVKLVEMEV